VLVAGDPSAGTCVMPAVHRSGDLLIAVTSGGVPRASARVRDDLARRLDDRYAAAIRELRLLRQRLLDEEDRAAWRSAASALLSDDFCDSVESGVFTERLAAWR
jgi:siroheme synthase (precorrin-2 oxidase/ferrochelatase)